MVSVADANFGQQEPGLHVYARQRGVGELDHLAMILSSTKRNQSYAAAIPGKNGSKFLVEVEPTKKDVTFQDLIVLFPEAKREDGDEEPQQ